ncbi:MAG: metallophosphoesterase [Pirellulaceae bacterium]|nr:metallophosphoesterase [Pirellulaceae bacterium]
MLHAPVPDVIPSEVDSLRLLHISDLHFGPPYVEVVGEAALRIAPLLKPDAVIVSGDLTQRAQRDQFLAAKAFLLQLPKVPQLVIPGNHDVPLYRLFERWHRPHRLYQQIISEELNPILRLDRAVIVGLDSTTPRTAISNGRIDMWQLDACEEAFRGVPADRARILVAHHHFTPAPDNLRDSIMPKAKRSIERFVDLRVDIILGGHLHRAFIGNSLDFYPGLHRDRGIICAQCGTTTSRRGRGRECEKNSLNLVEVRKHFISIIHYIYFHETGEFEAMSQHTFRRHKVFT